MVVTAATFRVQELAAVSPEGRIEFRIQRVLKSPNVTLGAHWRVKYRERQQWQAHLLNALVLSLGTVHAQRLLRPAVALPGCTGGCRDRRRVEVTRFAPSRRHFVRDDDNLRFAVKPVLDALKQLGLIRDDHRKWLDLALPTQDLSNDKTWWTWIAIDAAPL